MLIVTYSQERRLVLPGILGGQHHAFCATVAKTSRNDHARSRANGLPRLVVLGLFGGLRLELQVLGINPDQVELPSQVHGRVLERLDDRRIGIMRLHVLANQCNIDRSLVLLRDDSLPCFPQRSTSGDIGGSNRLRNEVESGTEQSQESLLLQEEWNLVDGWHISNDEDLVQLDLAMQGELRNSALCKRLFTSTGNLEFCQKNRFYQELQNIRDRVSGRSCEQT